MVTTQEENHLGSYSCPHLDDTPQTIIFDPDGDLHLIIGQNECSFQSCREFKHRTVSVKRDSQGQVVYHWDPVADTSDPTREPYVRYVDASTDTSIDANDTGNINTDSEERTRSKESSDDQSSTEEEEDGLDEELINKVAQEEEHDHKKASRFVVCSKALARTSRFFKQLLFGGYSESKKPGDEEQWTVHLPDDHPRAMWFLMAIAHGNVHWIVSVKGVALEDLYEITVLGDKYDMTYLITPFSSSWIKAVWDGDECLDVPEQCQALWISWVLGHKEIFKQCVDLISTVCCSDEQGRLKYSCGDGDYQFLFYRSLEPPGAQGLIQKRRLELLDGYLSPYCGIEEHIGNGKGAFVCNSDHCNAILRGFVLGHMDSKLNLPIWKTAEFRVPPCLLKERLDDIYITVKWLDNKHRGCLKRCLKHLGIGVEDRDKNWALSEFHERSLDAHARVSGLADTSVIHEDDPEASDPEPSGE